jgi:magnesium-protoporphyrin IX monomethyl ester (oxidative) cyclase
MPSLAFGIFSRVLKSAGHEVSVYDYLICRYPINESYPDKSFRKLIGRYHYDVIGISTYTATWITTSRMIDIIREYQPEVPIVVGGPHAIIHIDDIARDTRIDYIVASELSANDDILNVFTKQSDKKNLPEILIFKPSHEWIVPDFTSFFRYKSIYQYPLQTSKGCPHRCAFCASHKIEGREWRGRPQQECIRELQDISAILPNLRNILVVDDAPGTRSNHLKEFLSLYALNKIPYNLMIANMRADMIDYDLLYLAKKCGIRSITIGVEHGDPDIFNSINKGETLQDIIRSAMKIKNAGLSLGITLVVGFPGDTFEKTKASIKLAKMLKPTFIYWNMYHPVPKTKFYDDTIKLGGRIFDYSGYSLNPGRTIMIHDPIVETPGFSRYDRKRAMFIAIAETNNYELTLRELYYLLKQGIKYKMIWIAIVSALKSPYCELRYFLFKIRRGMRNLIYKIYQNRLPE